MVSDLCKNGLTCPTNGFEQKVHFQVFKIYVFLLFLHFFSNWFHVLRHSFYPKCETTFSKEFFFCFLCRTQKFLEICVNYVWNCVMPLFTPIEVQCSKNIFFKNILLPHLKFETCSKGEIWKISRRRITSLKNQGPYKSQLCKKWECALRFRENGSAITFYFSIDPALSRGGTIPNFHGTGRFLMWFDINKQNLKKFLKKKDF